MKDGGRANERKKLSYIPTSLRSWRRTRQRLEPYDTDGLSVTLATKLTDVINETMTDPMVGILHHEEGVDLVPANLELSAMEFNLVNAMSRETTLKNYLSQVKNRYDYVIIDCMPSLGMVTLNALSAADSVIIPVQAQYLPAKGMTQLVQTISKVKKYINPDIKIDGIWKHFSEICF